MITLITITFLAFIMGYQYKRVNYLNSTPIDWNRKEQLDRFLELATQANKASHRALLIFFCLVGAADIWAMGELFNLHYTTAIVSGWLWLFWYDFLILSVMHGRKWYFRNFPHFDGNTMGRWFSKNKWAYYALLIGGVPTAVAVMIIELKLS